MVSLFPRTALSLFLAATLAAATPAAQPETWPVPRGPSHEPFPHRHDPAQVKKLPRAFLEDAPACTLYTGTTHLVEPDGTVEAITHEVTRFNGRKGIEKLGEYRGITYDPAYQKLTLNVARVLKADGRVVDIAPRHVQLRDQGTDYQVYDHEKQLIISFPNLEVGDAIEVKWTTRGRNPEHQGQFFTRYSFGDDKYPVAIDEVRVRLPKSRALKYATVNGKLNPVIRVSGDSRHYHWQMTNCAPLPQDEYLPSKEQFRTLLACSTFASWEEVGRWKQKLRKDCWECTDEIKKVVDRVTAGLSTPLEKARALTYWIRRDIRYVSLGAVAHDYKPHPPASVLANRYGDCKDQAQLLAVMLRHAGIPVALVTLGTQDDGQIVETVPSPWGSHAILLVTIAGHEHWIDTTISWAPWDYLPRDDRDRLTYVTDEKGLRLKRTPPLSAGDNRVEQTTLVTVAADGTSRSSRRVVYHGVAAVAQREEWTEVPPGERRRLVTSALQDNNSRAHLRRLQVSERRLKDFDRPVAATLEFDIPRHFSGNPELEGNFTDSKVWSKLLHYTLDYDRQTPMQLGIPFESVHRYVIQLSPALRFESLPKDQQVRSPWGTFQLAVLPDGKDPRRFALEFRTRLDRTRVEVAEFARFRRFHEQVNKNWRAWITLKATQDLADAPLLEARLLLDPQDASAAGILAGLYCDQGRPADARRVLDWSRYFHPKSARLWELTVRAAPTLQGEEEAYQEMVRRFPEEWNYAVALGETRVKLDNHAGARTILEHVTQKGPAKFQASAHYQLARSSLAQKQPAAALKHLEAATRADAEAVSGSAALLFKGRVYEALGRSRAAVGAYRRAFKADNESADALNALVRLELAAGQRKEALDYLRRYTVVVSGEMQGLVNAADFHLQMARDEDAFDLASRALAIRFDKSAARIAGLVHLHRGETEKAVAALSCAERTPAALEGLLLGQVALGRLREAIKVLDQAKQVSEAPAGLRKACTLVERLQLRRDKVLKQVRGNSNKPQTWSRAADALVCAEAAHERKRGRKAVEKLLALAFAGGAEIGPAYSLRGLLALERGRLTRALADAERALVLDPRDARAYYVRGRVRFERGARGAASDLKRAADLSRRKDASILHALAAALLRGHHRKDALAAQRKAVQLRPDDQELRDQLREIENAK
jgi:tetratricopeptide (TPR) repeat protein/transglutaminase-like putative cysteine protease